MTSIEAMVEQKEALGFLANTRICLVTDLPNDMFRDFVGYFSYSLKGSSLTRRQYFYMEVNGQIESAYSEHKEIDFIVSFGNYLERKFRHQGLQVHEVHLPQAHGYSGNTYGYFTTQRLFPRAGIQKLAA